MSQARGAQRPGAPHGALGPSHPLDVLSELIAAAPHNLVSRRERSTVRRVHVEECVAVEPLLGARAGSSWLDLGTGGGLPGLVLATVRPDVTWTLVDATAKKVALVDRFARTLGLENVRTAAGRAEALARESAYRARFDGVVSRAVARLPILAELCRGFVRPGGAVVAIKGRRWREEVEAARVALPQLRLTLVQTLPVPTAARATWVVTMRADGPPPEEFPRRDGIPRSRPLGSDTA